MPDLIALSRDLICPRGGHYDPRCSWYYDLKTWQTSAITSTTSLWRSAKQSLGLNGNILYTLQHNPRETLQIASPPPGLFKWRNSHVILVLLTLCLSCYYLPCMRLSARLYSPFYPVIICYHNMNNGYLNLLKIFIGNFIVVICFEIV